MKKLRSRNEILDLIADQSGPIGPEVYAGFGSEFREKIACSGDITECMEQYTNHWIEESAKQPLLENLVAIAKSESLSEPHGEIKKRFKGDWEFHMADLIYRLIKDNLQLSRATVTELKNDCPSVKIAKELEQWLQEDN